MSANLDEQAGRRYQQRAKAILTIDDVANYAREVVRGIDFWLVARGERHFEAEIPEQDSELFNLASRVNVALVQFMMRPGAPSSTPIVNVVEFPTFAVDSTAWFEREIAPHLGETSVGLRIYQPQPSGLTIVKPNQRWRWTKTAGERDAGAISADHWKNRV
jgi:hypothetical protein